jgi:hypothetical protein
VPPDERLERVRHLREQGRTPKQIARALGIRPAEASSLVREAAVQARTAQPEPELAGCWISPGWSTGLAVGDHSGWPLDENPDGGTEGLIAVLVTRKHKYGRVSVCGYLVDAYCLGVKNALGPRIMDDTEFRRLKGQYFSGYQGDPVEAPIDLARELVLGSVQYARGLGFEPHPDFAAAAGHLGSRTGPGTITFGKDGKPFYIFGPYDDPGSVIRTLERSVGEGNFEVLAITG